MQRARDDRSIDFVRGKDIYEVKLGRQGIRDLRDAILQLATCTARKTSVKRAIVLIALTRTTPDRVRKEWHAAKSVLLPDIAVPLATYSGWNEYKPPYPKGELADRDGSCLPFPADKAAREAAGDPRLSIAERYASGSDYVAKVQGVVTALSRDRLLLAEDAERYLERARREPRVAP